MLYERIANARSFLFVPADRPERFGKAFHAGADMVIIDLEDAVMPGKRPEARRNIINFLTPDRPALLRINAAATADFELDLQICRHPGVCGAVLSKAENTESLAAIKQIAPHTHLLPLIETAQGLFKSIELAGVPGVVRLLFGTIDFQLDLGLPEDGAAMSGFRAQLTLASRLAGVHAPVDGVTLNIEDFARLEKDVLNAKAFGFGGKLCIHPKQIATVNKFFLPGQEERIWAEKVVAAMAQASAGQAGAISFEGQMIDRPVLLKAERIMRLAKMG